MSEHPAIGLLELTSIARGIVASDAMAKRAQVEIVRAQAVCPGKFTVLVAGDEESVRLAMETGVHYGGQYVVDSLVIPQVHPQVLPAMAAVQPLPGLMAVGIIETWSIAATVLAADAACKAAEITLIEIRLGTGLGGKAYVTLTGDQHSVEASLAAGGAAVESGLLLRSELIPAPHADLGRTLV
jgi:microcompartment protein CcmL/EutN